MPYGLLVQYALMAVAGASLLYWSESISLASIEWRSHLFDKHPALRKLPGTSETFDRKHSRTCVCVTAAILFAGGVSCSLGVFMVQFIIRFHFVRFHFVTAWTLTAFVLGMFAVLFLVVFRYSRQRASALSRPDSTAAEKPFVIWP
jgi:hypothetical protein